MSRSPVRRRPSPIRAPRSLTVLASAALLVPLLSVAPPAGADAPGSGVLQVEFARAASRHGVPESVLLAVSYLQSRWDAHGGAPSVAGGYGPMHLTDAVTARARTVPHHVEGEEDARGDSSRPSHRGADVPASGAGRPPERLRTLERASRLSGLPAEELRTSTAANIEGGAALLAAAQREAGLPASADPADWYGAVARYSGADDTATATAYANDVFDVIRVGASRTTDSGRSVTLPADPSIVPATGQLEALGLRKPASGPVECPATVACEWVPAPYEQFGDGDYGNHDQANRPVSQSIDYIVIHDTEADWRTTLDLVQDPTYVSWQYSLRSSDGHVAQHLPLRDVGWHAGNWFVNAKSVGL